MHSFITSRTAVLLLVLDIGLAARAQGTGDSPYSAYGFGDLLTTGQVSQAMMGGTGVAFTEPFSVILGDPASYAGLLRPVFEVGVSLRHTHSTFIGGEADRKDADFEGFTVGVPFANGKWGMALGLTPFSDVQYKSVGSGTVDEGAVQYEYIGSGGLNRAFIGLGHKLWQHRPDSLGNMGGHILLGADFNYLFGSIEQTRNAIYPSDGSFFNTRVFSSLVLRAPTTDASLMWQGDLTRKRAKDGDNWRYAVGLSADLPVVFHAEYTKLVTTYLSNSGFESVVDTAEANGGARGEVDLPVSVGLGASVQNAKWTLTAEVHSRDWGGLSIRVPGYALPTELRNSMTYAVGARFKPASEGNLLQRMVYRAGVRHVVSPLEVHGTAIDADAVTLGFSLPLNPVQTNSFLSIGGEFGQRGSTANGLLRERYATLWLGLSFTPWKGERWFTAPKIQ
jgi:hypothetical protein